MREEVLVQLTTGGEVLTAEETGELDLLDHSLLHLAVVQLDMTGHLSHLLTDEHAVLTQLAPHPPGQMNVFMF